MLFSNFSLVQALCVTACGMPLRETSCPLARMIWTLKLLLQCLGFFLSFVFAIVKPSRRVHTTEAARQLFVKYITQFQTHSQVISSSSKSMINNN